MLNAHCFPVPVLDQTENNRNISTSPGILQNVLTHLQPVEYLFKLPGIFRNSAFLNRFT